MEVHDLCNKQAHHHLTFLPSDLIKVYDLCGKHESYPLTFSPFHLIKAGVSCCKTAFSDMQTGRFWFINGQVLRFLCIIPNLKRLFCSFYSLFRHKTTTKLNCRFVSPMEVCDCKMSNVILKVQISFNPF